MTLTPFFMPFIIYTKAVCTLENEFIIIGKNNNKLQTTDPPTLIIATFPTVYST